MGSSLTFSLKEDSVRCAKVCDKSWVILRTRPHVIRSTGAPELVQIIIISNFPREIQTKEEDIVNSLNIFYHHLKLCMKCTAKNPGIWDFTKVQDGFLHQFNMWNYFGLEIKHFGIKNVNSDLKLGLSHQSRDWSPKFATGLNMIIDCNVWCIKIRTKLSSVLLLSLVRILMHQTLV